MSTPLIPTITSAKAVLNAADTTALLTAILGVSPLPAQKTPANIRQITVQILSAPAGDTSTVSVNFAP